MGVRATVYGAWLSALFRRSGISEINRRLLTADRCEELLNRFGASVGRGCVIHGPLVVYNAEPDYRNLSIGDNVHVGPLVLLDLAERLVLEDDATVSLGATILTHADVGDRPLADVYPRTAEPARVGAGAWIGANATVLVGCEIGERAVVAAGAVVRESVPDGAVVGGVPAEPLTHG